MPLPVPEDAPFFVKDYSEYYKGRAYHARSLNSNEGWNTIGTMSFLNQPILQYTNEIRSAVLIIHGEKDSREETLYRLPHDDLPGRTHRLRYDRAAVWEQEKFLLILTNELVSQECLSYLDGRNISWIVTGKERIDLARAAEILATEFGGRAWPF